VIRKEKKRRGGEEVNTFKKGLPVHLSLVYIQEVQWICKAEEIRARVNRKVREFTARRGTVSLQKTAGRRLGAKRRRTRGRGEEKKKLGDDRSPQTGIPENKRGVQSAMVPQVQKRENTHRRLHLWEKK